MADWLDASIACAWRSYEDTLEASGEGMRMELRELQHHMLQLSHQGTCGPHETTTYSYDAVHHNNAVPVLGAPNKTDMAATVASSSPDTSSATYCPPRASNDSLQMESGCSRRYSSEVGRGCPTPASSGAFGNRALWSIMLQAVSTCASNLAQHLSVSCHEEGILFARLWNLQTSLMDSDLMAVQDEAIVWKAKAQGLADKVQEYCWGLGRPRLSFMISFSCYTCHFFRSAFWSL
jgi:hypothetical protein